MAAAIYLVRHGESLGNQKNVYLGNRVDWDLSQRGFEQAERLADYFKTTALDAVYTSPLLRAYHTAEPTAQQHHLTLRLCPQLHEIEAGDWEGRTYDEIAREDPERWQAWLDASPEVRAAGGENAAEVFRRSWQALCDIARENDGKSVLVVTHCVVLRTLICRLMGKSLEQLSQVPFVGNASVSLAVFEKASASLRFCDERSHLGALATALPPQF